MLADTIFNYYSLAILPSSPSYKSDIVIIKTFIHLYSDLNAKNINVLTFKQNCIRHNLISFHGTTMQFLIEKLNAFSPAFYLLTSYTGGCTYAEKLRKVNWLPVVPANSRIKRKKSYFTAVCKNVEYVLILKTS